ncbi:Helitron helicase [Phytophthora megakarya]|uniref:Helitron helicase n=1 Tax=Phytophthora megakarya TaxID=4795 RepID=A0A225W2K9_9STRA|nr:Helitron helicase [Phytophthora megakarya]
MKKSIRGAHLLDKQAVQKACPLKLWPLKLDVRSSSHPHSPVDLGTRNQRFLDAMTIKKHVSAEDVDNLVWAELLDKDKYSELYETVISNMMHGPCGEQNPRNPCMK